MRITRIPDRSKGVMLGGAVASAAATVQGAIIYQNPADFTISGRTPQTAYIDFEGGTISATAVPGISDLSITTGANGTSKPYVDFVGLSGSTSIFTQENTDLQPVSAGTTIGPSTNYLASTSLADDFGDLYLGFRLNTPTPQYGWLSFSANASGPVNDPTTFEIVVIKEWAFETSGGTIVAGAVPEPSSTAMMAALAGSAALYRRRARVS